MKEQKNQSRKRGVQESLANETLKKESTAQHRSLNSQQQGQAGMMGMRLKGRRGLCIFAISERWSQGRIWSSEWRCGRVRVWVQRYENAESRAPRNLWIRYWHTRRWSEVPWRGDDHNRTSRGTRRSMTNREPQRRNKQKWHKSGTSFLFFLSSPCVLVCPSIFLLFFLSCRLASLCLSAPVLLSLGIMMTLPANATAMEALRRPFSLHQKRKTDISNES